MPSDATPGSRPDRRARFAASLMTTIEIEGLHWDPILDLVFKHYNEAPRRFIWTKDADTILGKIDRCTKVLNARD